MSLLLDAEQNFTCRSCGECCRRAFDIVVSQTERDRYEEAKAGRWFRETVNAEPGASSSPFEPAGSGLLRIRKRADGVCGFLSPENRCRIHEEMGGRAKPLTCQMFPFSFDPVSGETRVSVSFCCPTVVRNDGQPLEEQKQDISDLASRWRRVHQPADRPVEWARGHPLDPELLESMRWVFRRLLDRHEPSFSLRRNIGQIAALVEDWTRQRVLKLEADKFEEYVNLTGEFAATKPRDPAPVRQRVNRFLFRGFLFASLVPWASRTNTSGSGIVLRLRLLRLLLHLHGVAPGPRGSDFKTAFRGPLDIDAEPYFTPAYHALRALIENLGSGRRPVVDELNLGVAHLLAAEHIYLSRTESEGAQPAWVRAIMDAHDVAHADPASSFGRILPILSPAPSALHLFAARGGFVPTSSA